jgi:predicted permease
MDTLLRNLRHALRNLLTTPGFTVITVGTLALGIGANTAIFTVVNAVLLRPLAYPRPDQLLFISSQFPQLGFEQFWMDAPEFFEFRERTRSFASAGAFSTGNVNLSVGDQPRRVASAKVSATLFDTLGVSPMLGRVFTEPETLPNAGAVAVISSELWQTSFGARPDVIGSRVDIDGMKRTIIGVMPRGFDVADSHVLVWLPLGVDPADNVQNRGGHFLYVVARLAPGNTIASAKAELETLLAGWQVASGGTANAGLTGKVHTPNTTSHPLRIDPLQAQIAGGARRAIWVLQGAVLVVLLIACANLANLLLARAESRRREFAIRRALGAGTSQLLQQFVVEGCLLSFAGAIAGVGLAVAGIRVLIAAFPASLPRSGEVSIDAGVLAFTLVVALATGIVFGLAPLLHLAPSATAAALKDGGQRTAGGGTNRLRRGLVVAEVGMAVALVIGAGLLLRTVLNLSAVDAGFNRSRLVTFGVSLPEATYAKQEQAKAFYQALTSRLAGLPGVQSVTGVQGLPPLRDVNANDTDMEGVKAPPGYPFPNVDYYQTVTSSYAETMGIPVVQGRSFQPSDADGPFVVLINQTLARTFYPTENPIGRRLRPTAGPNVPIPYFTIVGILKDVKQGGLDKKTGTELYFNVDQAWKIPYGLPNSLNFALRTPLPPDALARPIRQAVAGIDPSLPIIKLRAMDDVFDEAIGRPRLLADLLGIFAVLALTLAAIGSYGVLSYTVTERRREIGIRMALGANRSSVLQIVLGQGLRLTVAGVFIGLVVAFAANRALASLLFGVGPSDPLTIGGVVALMAAVALVACYLPARTATRVDPMIVLRDE